MGEAAAEDHTGTLSGLSLCSAHHVTRSAEYKPREEWLQVVEVEMRPTLGSS